MSKHTPAAHWRENGEQDPHGSYYDRERADLALGNLTDDELANAVFLYGDRQPSVSEMIAGTAQMPIVYLTAGKERIRWLSRNLVKLEQQRDELLVAVEKVFFELERLDASGDVGGWIFDEVELLRSAIAKAKGGAA